MPALALSRLGARVVESGPGGGQDLAPSAWQRLEALPDPRSPRGRIYPLACLIAVALCAFTAAGNDRLTAVGQWVRRASQADLARLRAPWDPMTGRYRVPDEKTIRVVLDRLDPRALARALLGPRPRGRRRCGGPPSASVRRYRARRAAQQSKMLARGRLRAIAVDGKTSRGARRADGTRVHLLGVAEHGGHLLDHLEVGVKHNETTHFTELLGPADLDGAVVTFDALHTVRANLNWLVTEKKAQYIAVVKRNQPLLHAQVSALPWRQVPAGSATREKGHGRAETRTLKAAHVSGLDFPHARQAIKITRWRQDTSAGRISRQAVYAVTSLASAEATVQDLARLVREQWSIEMVFTQLAKRAVRPFGGGWEHVADLDLVVGDDHPVDEQFGQQPSLLEGGGGQPGADGLAECLDPVGDGLQFQPLAGGGVQLALPGGQGGAAAVQLVPLALEFGQGDDLGQVGVEQPLLLAVQLAQGLADRRLPGVEFLGQPGAALRPV